MRIKLLLFFILLSSVIGAQEEKDFRQVYMQAEEEYNIGHFDNSIRLLNKNLNLFTGMLRTNAWRLMALCHLEQDNLVEAEKNVFMLLKTDPYYSVSIHDPLRFADMVERLKKGEATITTASQQAETLDEVPVPVTLITEEMIKVSGARNLSDLLLLYVPGMSLIEGDEANIAMHGVYSSSQEKILIMLDGHRLNSRATNSEAPDYRSGLDKIKQIEVLRGPSSSLYGNVALTAVVNIISKKGNDVDGVKASLGYGNNQTYRGDFTFGKSGFGIDFMAWASVYSSKGEKRHIGVNDKDFYGKVLMPGSMYIGGYNGKPAYDLGFTCSWRDFKFLFSTQYSKKTSIYNSVFFGSLYDYDRYRRIEGDKPGHSRQSTHVDFTYKKDWRRSSWKATVFSDFDHFNYYDVCGDSISPEDETKNGPQIVIQKGAYQSLVWNDYTYGINSQYSLEYNKKEQKGIILIGLQFENYVMRDNTFLMGDNFKRIVITYSDEDRMLNLGNEVSFSSFFQLKHDLGSKLIFNGGLRHDYKHRYNGKILNAFSPRMSLNYLFKEGTGIKLSYSHSFVDAPFLYRANTLQAYKGAEDLDAEKMDALQLSFNNSLRNTNLSYDINIFYNNLSSLIYHDAEAREYRNSGKLDLAGIEGSISYKSKTIFANINSSYQRVLKTEHYKATGGEIYYVPSFTMNITNSYQIVDIPHLGKININGNINIANSQKAPQTNNYIYKNGNIYWDPDRREKARAILNMGVIWSRKNISISFNAYNILNTQYYQGGTVQCPNPQQGINCLCKTNFKF